MTMNGLKGSTWTCHTLLCTVPVSEFKPWMHPECKGDALRPPPQSTLRHNTTQQNVHLYIYI